MAFAHWGAQEEYQVSTLRHSVSGLRTMTVSIIENGAGSVDVSARPALPSTVDTSGNCLMMRSCTCINCCACVTEIPGSVVALAANGDNTSRGDHTYTARYTLTSPSAVPAPQPAISAGGVFNAASFQPGVSAGSWVTIQGSNLAGNTRSWTGDDFEGGALPTQLDGVSVKIDGKPAYVAFISPAQINVQAPADSALGPVPVEVTYNGSTSSPGTAQLQAVSPALFLWSGKYAVATHPDFSPAAAAGLFPGVTTVPAKPGETIVLWGTGFGATTPAVAPGIVPPANPLANVANPITATIGNMAGTVVGAAISPGNPGLYQIEVQVPDSVPDGDLPVVAQVNGVQSSSNVLLSVKR